MNTTDTTTAPAGRPLHPIPAPWADELMEAAAAAETYGNTVDAAAYTVPAPSAYALAAARATAARHGARLEGHPVSDDHGHAVYAADGELIGAVHTEDGAQWHAVNFLEYLCTAADTMPHDETYPTPAAAVDAVLGCDEDNRDGFDHAPAR